VQGVGGVFSGWFALFLGAEKRRGDAAKTNFQEKNAKSKKVQITPHLPEKCAAP